MLPSGKFIIGVWQQPASSFSKWQGRGVNCLVDLQQGALRSEVLAVAEDRGFGVVIEPDPLGPAIDLRYKSLWGWLQKPDEPENPEHVKTLDANGRKDFVAAAKAWQVKQAELRQVSKDVPVFGNFNGMILTAARDSIDTSKPPLEQNIIIPEYLGFMAGCDYVGADWHVRNANRTADKIGPLYSKMMNLLARSGKPTFTFVECAQQNRPERGPAPSPSEMRAEAWLAIMLGAKGLCYFPAKISGGYVADNTPDNLVAEMQKINAEIKKAEAFLMRGQRNLSIGNMEYTATWDLNGSSMFAKLKWTGTEWACDLNIPTTIAGQIADLQARVERLEQKCGLVG